MKKFLLITTSTACLLIEIVFAQAPNWTWAKSAGGVGGEQTYRITSDAIGNIYVAGYFLSPQITFGNDTLFNNDQILPYSADIFFVKYDFSGNVVWAKNEGGTGADIATDIILDVSSNLVISGRFSSPQIIIGNDTIFNTSLNEHDIFIVKYDTAGNAIWAKSAGGNGDQISRAIAGDANGNILITGQYNSVSFTFDSITLNNTSAGTNDIFIAKYDSVGNIEWAQNAGNINDEEGTGISIDASGCIYLTGTFQLNLTIGSFALTGHFFVAKFNPSGNVLWASGYNPVNTQDIITDDFAHTYIIGSFTSYMTIFGNDTVNSPFLYNVFLLKIDSSGQVLWAKAAGGAGTISAWGITKDIGNNIYITGAYSGYAVFGSDTLTSVDYYDVFVAKYDNVGTVLWAKSAGGTNYDNGHGITVDPFNNVYIAGDFQSSNILFDSLTLNYVSGLDVFVGKLGSTITGANEFENINKQIFIFPNPTTSYLAIALGNINKKIEVTITDITGKIIYTTTVAETQKIEICTKDFAEGIYLARIQTEEFLKTEKLIIAK